MSPICPVAGPFCTFPDKCWPAANQAGSPTRTKKCCCGTWSASPVAVTKSARSSGSTLIRRFARSRAAAAQIALDETRKKLRAEPDAADHERERADRAGELAWTSGSFSLPWTVYHVHRSSSILRRLQTTRAWGSSCSLTSDSALDRLGSPLVESDRLGVGHSAPESRRCPAPADRDPVQCLHLASRDRLTVDLL